MSRRLAPFAAAALAVATLAAVPRAAPPVAGVLEHHGGPRRDGVYRVASLTRAAAATVRADPAFRAQIPGAIYAQPLYVPAGRGKRDLVLAVTEEDQAAAFDATTGATVWARKLGDPVPIAWLPCGNIDPLGVTGTPVVDPATRTLYLDAMTRAGGRGARHLVFALSVDDGSTRPGWPVAARDVARRSGLAFDDLVQNQRGALALARGVLYVPFGGHFGDCGRYRGWLLAIPVERPSEGSAWRTAARGGGIWAPSGVAADDAAGRLFVATGNTLGARSWADGDAVLSFDAGAPLRDRPRDAFAPADWARLDEEDVDLGGTGPVLVDLPGARPAHLVVALGKDGKMYLLDRDRLGGVGGAAAIAQVTDDPIINAAAAYTTARGTYVVFRGTGKGCPGGGGDLTAVRLGPGAPPSIAIAWCAREGGRGSPMVTTTDGHAEAVVWTVGAEGDGRLRAFDGDTGRPLLDADAPRVRGVRRFQAPIAGGGRLYVAVDGGVRAFSR